jgi:regulator of sigma E protease
MLSGLLGFLVAILVLVSVHEYGHFIVGRFFGVRVLRFSVGFGRPIWSMTSSKGTEFCIASIPLGGYVKFLDTREIDSLEQQQSLTEKDKKEAFDLQAVHKRIAIVFAGPLINFLLAILLFTMVSYGKDSVLLPVINAPQESSVVHQAGLREGDKITQLGEQKIEIWNDVFLGLIERSLHKSEVQISYTDIEGHSKISTLSLDKAMSSEKFSWKNYGLLPWQPKLAPVIEKLRKGNGVDNSTLRENDLILSIADKSVQSWQDLVFEVQRLPNQKVSMRVLRDGAEQLLEVGIGSRIINKQVLGFLGAQVKVSKGAWSDVVMEVDRGFIEAFYEGINKTAKVMNLITVSVFNMITGGVGFENLGGPITIAKQAGNSAELGLSSFLVFLAFLSISLGVLNLLPIPLLDGGHIVLYTWEWITGKVPSDKTQMLFQRIGFSIVIALTVIALLNDLLRL